METRREEAPKIRKCISSCFICDKISLSSIIGANDKKPREGTLLVALNWLERRYGIYTSKSKRRKSLAKFVSLRSPSGRLFSCARTCISPESPKLEITQFRPYKKYKNYNKPLMKSLVLFISYFLCYLYVLGIFSFLSVPSISVLL